MIEDYLRRKRELKREREQRCKLFAGLGALYDKYGLDVVIGLCDTRSEEYKKCKAEKDTLEALIRQLDTQKLMRSAHRMNMDVDLPAAFWGQTDGGRIKYLTDEGQARLGRLLRERRFEYMKRWVDILIPILSLLVALAAILKS